MRIHFHHNIYVYLCFETHKNPHGWLPPCRPVGPRWLGTVQMLRRRVSVRKGGGWTAIQYDRRLKVDAHGFTAKGAKIAKTLLS
ncbi:MAG: hypothetical protein E4G94_05075 [ANME-2 cluster archaeon]|nr:MAG: hypothetical protein E4G94_05075 [ANME-2 cluster archaeon]